MTSSTNTTSITRLFSLFGHHGVPFEMMLQAAGFVRGAVDLIRERYPDMTGQCVELPLYSGRQDRERYGCGMANGPVFIQNYHDTVSIYM